MPKPNIVKPYGKSALAAGAFRADQPDTILGDSGVLTVTSAELLALNATPKTLIAAPGAGKILWPEYMLIHKPAGTAYAGIAAGEDLALKWTDASGTVLMTCETTGFLDQATAQERIALAYRAASGASQITPTANAALVLHMLTGEIITGDSPLYVQIFYRLLKSLILP
jgi:hypothetical protein